jgi:hypothetical protein
LDAVSNIEARTRFTNMLIDRPRRNAEGFCNLQRSLSGRREAQAFDLPRT